MTRNHLVLVLFCVACGGGSAAPPTTGAAAPPAEAESDEVTLLVGGCTETPVNDEVKRVDGRNLPWAFVVVSKARVDCQERRVIVHAVPGLDVVLASFREAPDGSRIAAIGPALVEAAAADFQNVDPNAALSEQRDATLGENHLQGRCGRVDFTKDGHALVTHVCAAWATLGEQSHLAMVMFTNTEADNVATGVNVQEIMDNMVDAFVLNPTPLE